MKIPIATYRIQSHFACPLKKILPEIEYFHRLGISHLYLSPILAANKKSTHGYDVVDFSRINPEVGSEKELESLAGHLNERGMGIILDFIPNHMCIISKQNRWWWSVLKEGINSPYASFFDIDWFPPDSDLSGKVLLPFLGESREEAVKEGKLIIKEENGELVLAYNDMRFPYNQENEYFVLDCWKRGDQDLNYRRFFNISDLACICMEESNVFSAAHSKIFEWIENGWVDGLRLDHIDGLYDPKEYLMRLHQKWPNLPLFVEKILIGEEELIPDWEVEGTTGYEFLNLLNGIFVDTNQHEEFKSLYQEFISEKIDFDQEVLNAKKHILFHDMAAERKRICRQFSSRFSSYPEQEVNEAIVALLINFPVYRTYLPENGENIIRDVLKSAKGKVSKVNDSLWKGLETLFLHSQEIQDLDLVKKFQQTTGPVMAKGLEDTAFYRYFPLASMNEVGGNPKQFGVTIEKFHEKNQRRQELFPFSLIATTTHDTKRSEDVRARLNVLSEMPKRWKNKINLWKKWNAHLKTEGMPNSNTEYLLYQTLVASWPHLDSNKWDHGVYVNRIKDYMLKAAREEKKCSNWSDPNLVYEKALLGFIQSILTPRSQFYDDIDKFVNSIAVPGFYNSLAQTVIKATSPGIPDFYQGTELWSFTLVDPDNRKVVDFKSHFLSLKSLDNFERLVENIADGRLKLYVTQKSLQCRSRHVETFQNGKYIPLKVSGKWKNHLIAFSRVGKQSVITLCGRFLTNLPNGIDWEDTIVHLPNNNYKEVFSERMIEVNSQLLYVNEIFQLVPIALLEEIV